MKTLGLLLSFCLAACAGQADVRYSGTVATPELVALDSDPSVMVVANSDEPVFFSENVYWLYRDNHWYRSHSHRSGWARVDTPPDHLRRIERPVAYVHFRGEAQRTTANEPSRAVEPARPPVRAQPGSPMPAEDVAPTRDARPDAPAVPHHEPNPQGPSQPYANPLPPHQVPPVPNDGITPDADRPPATPGMRNRSTDQRPATDREDRRDRGPAPDQPPPPTR